MRVRILGYKSSSHSAKTIAIATGFKRLRPPGRSKFTGKPSDLIFNWGSSEVAFRGPLIINPPHAVINAINKESTYNILREKLIPTVESSFDRNKALEWLDKYGVLFMYSVTSSGGVGMTFVDNIELFDELCNSRGDPRLWVKYTPKAHEYRVHVWDSAVLDVQEKKLKEGASPNKIRSHENGYIFARADIAPPSDVLNYSVKAVKALKLDFGAVDVGYTTNTQKIVVYEVNTAPGLEGETLNIYSEQFHRVWDKFKEENA